MSAQFLPSVCPHDCPSSCALEIERLDAATIGRVRGVADHPYTAGAVCAKVARYAERTHSPDRLTVPLKRSGPKGSGCFEPISWDEALDTVASAFQRACAEFGPETVWPYFQGGTLGLLHRNGIQRLGRSGGYSRIVRNICMTILRNGWVAGTGAARGVSGLEAAESDLIVFWGTNPAATNLQLLNLALKARRERGATIVNVDPYRTRTAEVADRHFAVRPGTDGALAVGMMHVLFRDGLVDRAYMARYTDCPDRLEAHLKTRTPEWAAAITGIDAAAIVGFARLYGQTRKSFIRVGVGFSRQRNGAANAHAVACLPAVTGAWQERGGGALAMSGGTFAIDLSLIDGGPSDAPAPRALDQVRIGDILTGDPDALLGGPLVTAMLIQHTNPAVVAPESAKVRVGLARDDLFVCVHEQFMTETALLADIVLPATTFVEHDDLYTSNGHTFLRIGKRIIDSVGQSRSNHDVICALAQRLGIDHPSDRMSAWELIDATLRRSGFDGADAVHAARWVDCAKDFETAHFLNGFSHPDGKFRFAPDWAALGPMHSELPQMPDHAPLIEKTDGEHPFRLVTAPARNFLNTTFGVCPGSRRRETRPTALVHPDDCRELGIEEGDRLRIGNRRGDIVVHLRPFDGLQRGVIVVEGLWPNADFVEGKGVNTLVGSDPVAPGGGGAFHDTAVWARPV